MSTKVMKFWMYDVWGNEDYGYEVNDRFRIPMYDTDEPEDLKDSFGELEFDFSNEGVVYIEKNGKPIGELVEEE